MILKREPDLAVLAQAGSVIDARDMLVGVSGEVDVALIDLQLPDGDGVKVIGDIRVMHPRAQILAPTAVIDPAHHARAIGAGAVKIISKAAQPAEIIACIRQTRDGSLVASAH